MQAHYSSMHNFHLFLDIHINAQLLYVFQFLDLGTIFIHVVLHMLCCILYTYIMLSIVKIYAIRLYLYLVKRKKKFLEFFTNIFFMTT